MRRWIVGNLSVRRVVTGLLFVYGLLLAFAWLVADRLIYQPHPASYTDDAGVLHLHPSDGALIAARFSERPKAQRVVLFSHGNAEDLGDVAPLVDILARHGLDVLAYDYEGYGTSTGTPSEAHLQADILAAYEHLTVTRKIAPANIIVYGRSRGSGPRGLLASTHPVGGLILESAFKSPFRVITRVRLLPWDPFPNLERLGKVKCPVLVIHAEHDGLIAFSQGKALFEAAPEPKLSAWMPSAGHADIPFVDRDAYDAAIDAFLARLSTR